jgi:hypothetical protein
MLKTVGRNVLGVIMEVVWLVEEKIKLNSLSRIWTEN